VNRLGLDAIYVLNVRAYTDRRAHVERELARFGLEAEFILDFDVPDLTPELEARWFVPGCTLRPGQKSCAMKHVAALQRIVAAGHLAALVLEDDVVLEPGFAEGVQDALREAAGWAQPHVLFIGSGGNFYTPRSQRRPGQRLYRGWRGRFGDSYILGAGTAALRLAWIAEHRIGQPIDNQFETIDKAQEITMLWLEPPVVEQGSKNGLFTSALEHKPPSPPMQRLKFALEKLRRKYLYQLWR
jgi:glycosyl transferase family 25